MRNCAFKAFDGKTTQIQRMVVEDINNKDVVRPGMSVGALDYSYNDDNSFTVFQIPQDLVL